MNSTSVTICETPGDTTFCHFLKFAQVSDTFLTCVSACLATELVYTNSTFSQCVTSCPAAAKYIQLDQTSCGSTCSTGFFSYNTSRSNPQCLATCPFPLTKITNATYSGYKDCESTCTIATGTSGLFINRAEQLCLTSCQYVNTSTINSISYSICELTSDSTNCPWYSYLDASAFTCHLTCSTF